MLSEQLPNRNCSGVILSAEENLFLSRSLQWVRHAGPHEAFVHPENIIERLARAGGIWTSGLIHFCPARYNGEDTIVTGFPKPLPKPLSTVLP
ncbi:MAG: hypothetical protein HY397_00520 [Candidatus Doudnabacteria bacterium]|nr:hypothetical protein [Candidatus Doudnabacteria bacterium]